MLRYCVRIPRDFDEHDTIVEADISMKRPTMAKDSLTRSAGRGALWQFVGGGWQTLVRLGASTILARTLVPEDFGLFGMAILAQTFLNQIGALGMGAGVIAKKEVTNADLCTCFWTMAGMRTLLFLAGWLGAPLAGSFFGDPRVVPVLRIVSITFLFSIVGVVPQTVLTKELRFKPLVIIRGIAILMESSVAVLLVLLTDLGYWALVTAMVASAAFENIVIALVVWWMPKFVFDKSSFRYLFRFGFSGLVFSVFNYLTQNLDYVIVGRMLGAGTLGLYEFAYRIPHMVIDRISRPVGAVVFPALSKVQDRNDLIVKGYIRAIQSVIVITYPMLGFLAIMAEPLVLLLWGDRWIPIVIPLRILCVCAALRCIFQPLGSVFNAKQRPDLPAKFSIIRTIVTGALVVTLGNFWGLTGVAYAMLLSVLPSLFFGNIAFQLCNTSMFSVIRGLAEPIAAVLIAVASSLTLKYMMLSVEPPQIIMIIALGMLYSVIYLGSLFFLFRAFFEEIKVNVWLVLKPIK